MGRKKGPWLAWVKQGDLEQCEWLLEQFEHVATEQLSKKDKGDPELSKWLWGQLGHISAEQGPQKEKEDLYGAIRTVVGLWPDPNVESVETKKIREMCLMLQKRWGSHSKRTRHPGKRNYTFFMKKSLAPKICAIAKLWGMNEENAIEMLITTAAENKKAAENYARLLAKDEYGEKIERLNDTIRSLNEKLDRAKDKRDVVKPLTSPGARTLKYNLEKRTAELDKLKDASRHWLAEIHTLKILMRDMGVIVVATPAQVAEADAACAKALHTIFDECNKVEAEALGQTANSDDARSVSPSSDSKDTESPAVSEETLPVHKPVISDEKSDTTSHCTDDLDSGLEGSGYAGENDNPETLDSDSVQVADPVESVPADQSTDDIEGGLPEIEMVDRLQGQQDGEMAEVGSQDKLDPALDELEQLSARLMEIKRDVRRGILPGDPEYSILIDRYCRLKYEDKRSHAIRNAQIRSWMFDIAVSGYTFDEDKYPQINVETLDDQSNKTSESLAAAVGKTPSR